jgi:hypothetical protein
LVYRSVYGSKAVGLREDANESGDGKWEDSFPSLLNVSLGSLLAILEGSHTARGRLSSTRPEKLPIAVRRRAWTKVCSASSVTGASMPLRADLERIVLRMAHEEWKSTVRVTRKREGGGRASSGGFAASMAKVRLPSCRNRRDQPIGKE